MKKLVLFAVVAVAFTISSCSNKANTDAAPSADSTAVVEQTPEVAPADSAAEAVEEVAATPAN